MPISKSLSRKMFSSERTWADRMGGEGGRSEVVSSQKSGLETSSVPMRHGMNREEGNAFQSGTDWQSGAAECWRPGVGREGGRRGGGVQAAALPLH